MRVTMISLPLVAAAALLAGDPASEPAGVRRAPTYYGINLSAAGFAPERLPGVHGQHYLYPDRKIAAPFVAMGMNTVRLPFLWERLQPQPFGEFAPDEVARLDRAVADFDEFSAVILDVHNYARFRGTPLDRMDRGGEALADLWSRLAVRYRANPRIVFGLMNEPHGIDAVEWRKMVDQSIAAIRRSGARQLILVPGVRWSGGSAWFEGGSDSSASAMAGLRDPANNMLFEIHQYFDSNSSGTGTRCVSATIGKERLERVTRWLRQQRTGAILGEFGASSEATCLAALDQTLGFMEANGDVWRGWTYWAAGDWWGAYPYSIQPDGDRPKPQSEVLRRYVARYRQQPFSATQTPPPGE